MSVDGPTPIPCDKDIFKNGETLVTLAGSSTAVEIWVKSVAKQADARIDWHYSGGIANVLHLGDKESRNRAQKAVITLTPELDGQILQRFLESEAGPHRSGVTVLA